jgi:hypothetical protein
MNLLNHKAVRAAVMALALGAVAIPALPAQAQSFSFEFGTGGGSGGDFWGGGRHHRPHMSCLTDYQVRQRIAQYGYRNVRLNVANGPYIQAKATRGSRTYLIDFNRCTGRIEGATRLRTPRENNPWNNGRPHWNGNQWGGDDKDEAGDLH